MRPLRLELAGFGSFVEPAQIEFSDAELFAITGPTGSGKTTILDAMTFALYGETPRMGRKGLKALLSPGVNKAAVQLTFRLGAEVWRVTRVIAGKTEARLERQMGADWQLSSASEKIKALNEAVEKLLGLDYEAFTRAIMLPQGQFDAFLKGDGKDRRELLFSLYGLEELATLRERAMTRLAGLREELAAAEATLQHLEGVSEEALAQAREELERLKREEKETSAELSRLERELRKLEGLADLWREKQELERRAAALTAEAERMAEVEGWLERARAAEQALPEVDKLAMARKRLAAAENDLIEKKNTYDKVKTEWEKLHERFDEDEYERLKSAVAALPLLEAKVRTLKALGEAPEGTEVEDYDEETYRRLEKQLRSAEERRKALDEVKRLRKREAELKTRIDELQEGLKAATKRQEELKTAGVQLKEKLDETKKRLEDARRSANVASFRHLLKPGEPCPLCGQIVHELPRKAENPLAGLEAEAERLNAQLEEMRGAWREAGGEIKGMRERLNDLRKQLAEVEQDRERAESRAGERGAADEEQISARLAAMRRGLAAEIAGKTNGQEPAEYARRLRDRLAGMERVKQQLGKLAAELERSAADLQAAKARREALAESLVPLEESVNALLARLGFENAAEAQKARRSAEEIAGLEERLKRWRDEKAYLKQRREELERELAGKQEVSGQELAAKKELRAELAAKRQSLSERLGALQEKADRLERDLAAKRAAAKKAAGMVAQVGVWEQLAEDLKGHKFPDYLLNRLQLDMLARASELLFTLSQQRYRFHLVGGVYHVEDLWTGVTRPAKTLSGGETFLASLSLALSLSEHLSRGRLGALFLDEGFGTLDAEALELAAEVLEALPTQGRMVGVVTHVTELAQRMPLRLVVEKTPQGSRVRWEE